MKLCLQTFACKNATEQLVRMGKDYNQPHLCAKACETNETDIKAKNHNIDKISNRSTT